MKRSIWQMPRARGAALAVFARNFLVWRKLLGPAIVLNFGEPVIYLLGLGIGLGRWWATSADCRISSSSPRASSPLRR